MSSHFRYFGEILGAKMPSNRGRNSSAMEDELGQSVMPTEWMERLEQPRRALVERVGAWPEELQARRPADGGWSALEVLEHLVRSEVGICGLVEKHLAAPQPIGVRDRIGFAMVESRFLSPGRVKVPDAVKEILPCESLGLTEIASRWDAVRAELRMLAGRAEGCRGGVFRHPVAGWMSFEQVLRFFEVHMVHHGYQLDRIAAELGAT